MSRSKRKNEHPVSEIHFKQINCRLPQVAEVMQSYAGVTWRPSGKNNSFLNNHFRPLGWSVLVAEHSQVVEVRGRTRQRINLCGYKTEIDPHNGKVSVGGVDRNCFYYDFGLRPYQGSNGRVLDPYKNPSLAYLGLEMDRMRANYASRRFTPRGVPPLPIVYLGFPPELPLPPFVDSLMLRSRVARHLRRPIGAINAMGLEQLDPLLKAEWPTCFIPPGGDNGTGMQLLNLEFTVPIDKAMRGNGDVTPITSNVIRPSHAHRLYEGFTELLGAEIRNPARELISPRHTIANPTRSVASKYKISLQAAQNIHAETEEDEEAGIKLEKGIREALGPLSRLCSDDDIADMLMASKRRIVPTGLNSLNDLTDQEVLELMRAVSGHNSNACTDEDLIQAARNPNRPLYARGLASIEIVRFDPANIPASLCFGPEQLCRERTVVDLYGVRPYWVAGQERVDNVKNHAESA